MLVASGTPSDQCKPGQLAKITSRIVLAVPKAIQYSELPVELALKYTERAEVLERALALGLRAIYSGHADVVAPDWSRAPFNPENFEIVSHADNGSWRWDVNKLDFGYGVRATVGEMIRDMADAGVILLNATVAESLVLNEHEVPESWRDRHMLFPGTIFLDNNGERFVRGVYCGAGKKRTPFTAHFSESWRKSWRIAKLNAD